MKPSELRRIRNSLGLTQAEMGRALGAHRVSVARWEAGTRAVPVTVAKLARLLAEVEGVE